MSSPHPEMVYWCAGLSCCDPLWEQAYRDFETPAEELKKFLRRYRQAGIDHWPRDREIVELFCGTGVCLDALNELGFTGVEGVDLSPELLAEYDGPMQTYVGDCRDLHFADQSKDAIIIQGGLHHLPDFPQDIAATLREIRRVLRPDGVVVILEPWLTPFLRLVHLGCGVTPARRVWKKLDAVARMNEQEWPTYSRWLSHPREILDLLGGYFHEQQLQQKWGKLLFVGQPRASVQDQESDRS